MKQLVKVQEVEGEGLVGLMGQRVLVMCSCYFYSGLLVGVNDTFVKLDDCHIVYETGAWGTSKFSDSQRTGDGHYVMCAHIESFRQDDRK